LFASYHKYGRIQLDKNYENTNTLPDLGIKVG